MTRPQPNILPTAYQRSLHAFLDISIYKWIKNVKIERIDFRDDAIAHFIRLFHKQLVIPWNHQQADVLNVE